VLVLLAVLMGFISNSCRDNIFSIVKNQKKSSILSLNLVHGLRSGLVENSHVVALIAVSPSTHLMTVGMMSSPK